MSDEDLDTTVIAPPSIGRIADLTDDSEIVPGSRRISADALKMIRDAGKRAANGEAVGGAMVIADLDGEDFDPIVRAAPEAPLPVAEAPSERPARVARPVVDAPPPDDRAASVIAQWDAVTERQKSLDAREAALREREATYGDVSERLAADPLALVRDLAKQRLGAGATETEIDGEVGYLLTDMSMKLAKVEDDPNDVKAQLRKMRRELDQSNLEKRRGKEQAVAAEKARAEEQTAAVQRQRSEESYRNALTTVQREFTAEADVSGQPIASLAKECPFLALEDDFASKIFDLIKQDHDAQLATGKPVAADDILSIAEAARMLEKPLAERFTKRQHLLQPSRVASTATADHQGGRPVKARSLTQADASEDAPPPPRVGLRTKADDRAETNAALKGTFRKLREAAYSDE